MSNEKNISEQKLIDLYYFAIGDGNFIKALEKHCNGQGFGNEHIWCLFAGELEEWEEGYFGENGVCYFLIILQLMKMKPSYWITLLIMLTSKKQVKHTCHDILMIWM